MVCLISTRAVAFCALLFAMCAAVVAHAYEVSPMRIFLVPAEGRNQATLTINNIRAEVLPVEIKVFRRDTAIDGTETLVETEDAFLVFPPQVQVAANSAQAIRIQYMGPADITQSVAYVVQVVEVPVTTEGFSGVRFTYNFGSAVYVEPPRAVERSTVMAATRDGDGLRLTVRNDGTKYGLLHQHRLIVEVGGRKVELTGDDLAGRIENPLLPPGMDREFRISVPELPADGAVSAELRAG